MLYFPNPAISARKKGRFSKFSTFFQIRTSKKVLIAHRSPIYKIKASKIPCKRKRNDFVLINICASVRLWGNLEEFGEILGKYRILDGRYPGYIGLRHILYSCLLYNEIRRHTLSVCLCVPCSIPLFISMPPY